MKKLDDEKRQIVEHAVETAVKAYARAKSSGVSFVSPEWRTEMQSYWDSQKIIMSTLGCSMTRCQALIDGKATLDSYYELDGTPKKLVAA